MKMYKGFRFDDKNNIVYDEGGEIFKGNYNQCIHFINFMGKGNVQIPYRVDLDDIKHRDPAYENKVAAVLRTMPVYAAWSKRCEYLGDVYEPLETYAREQHPDEYAKACEQVPYTHEDAKRHLDAKFDAEMTRKGLEGIRVLSEQDKADNELWASFTNW
jgi:hypothetical protein